MHGNPQAGTPGLALISAPLVVLVESSLYYCHNIEIELQKRHISLDQQ